MEVAVQDVKTIEAHLSACNGDKAIPECAVGGGCGAIVATHGTIAGRCWVQMSIWIPAFLSLGRGGVGTVPD